MAQYSHLPIYTDAFILLREMYQRVPRFNKQYKYLLGGEMIKMNIEAIRLILEINNTRETNKRKELLGNLVWCSESIIGIARTVLAYLAYYKLRLFTLNGCYLKDVYYSL